MPNDSDIIQIGTLLFIKITLARNYNRLCSSCGVSSFDYHPGNIGVCSVSGFYNALCLVVYSLLFSIVFFINMYLQKK